MRTKTKTPETLWIVSPCYNDEDTIIRSVPILVNKINYLVKEFKVSSDSKLLLVDDGSADNTWKTIQELQKAYSETIKALHLEQNSGEMTAYMAGMKAAVDCADLIVTIDCDLQDDIDLIDEMLDKHEKGAEIVYGCRSDRSADSLFYRICAGGFYVLMRAFGSKIIPHSSSFRLMTKNAVQLLLAQQRKTLFPQAELPLFGLTSEEVYYARKDRIAGRSGYNYFSLTRLAAAVLKEYTVFFEAVAVSAATLLAAVIFYRGEKHGKR